MACRKCGSDWVTATGKDCSRCPHCDRQQLFKARRSGRWVEPVQVKQCSRCGREFDAVGPKQIKQRVLCRDPECEKSHRKAGKERRAAGIFLMQQSHGTERPKRNCKRCGKGPLTRDQKEYCSRPCFFAAVDAGEQQFKGRLYDVCAALADWAYDWDFQRPRPRKQRSRKDRPGCELCGKECNEGSSRFCSRECNKAWRGPRECKCGALVPGCTARGRPSCIECKTEARRLHRRMYGCYRRRCRTYGGNYNPSVKPRDVFERDNWRCHVCGKKTSKRFRLDDPRSATVDHHPVPLSKCGDHDWHNVRCCCFECNSLKGAKWDGQMRMRFAI